ncbi:MAG: TolC family protein [Otoolea sp.]|nr:TolC family protein [Clostridium sp.]MDY5483180.1 TolC family protein [Clostridium sp.]
MKGYKKITALTAAAVLCALAPVQALAASPEFARDEATWARLRDNVMEYDELEMLVEEYNPTYLNNLASYRDNKSDDDAKAIRDQKYENAQDAYSAADDLRDQADSIMDLIDAGAAVMMPSLGSAYAGLIAGANMSEQNALKLEQGADASYEDSKTRELNYLHSQKSLIVQAQSLFSSYHQVEKSLTVLEKNLEIAKAGLATVERQVGLGMATQVDLLNTQKSVQSLQSTYTQTQASLETIRQQLCMATGWKYNDQPEIREMPAADQSLIAQMNPENDIPVALEQNLALKANRESLKNMSDGSTDKKNMERTIANQEESIRSGMKNLYNDVLLKQISYQLAQTAMETETKAMNTASTKFQLGMISKTEYLNAEASYAGKQADLEVANINLQQAIETYDWAMKGYMTGV